MDLKGEVSNLTKQLNEEKRKFEEKDKKSLKDSDRKTIEKEISNLEKQVSKEVPPLSKYPKILISFCCHNSSKELTKKFQLLSNLVILSRNK
jgi:F0F1-type ATP synthase membrane subunit b/b'